MTAVSQGSVSLTGFGLRCSESLRGDPCIARLADASPQIKPDLSKAALGRWLDPTAEGAIAAIGAAIRQGACSSSLSQVADDRRGVVAGTKHGPITTRHKLFEGMTSKTGGRVSATLFAHCGYNMAAATAAIAHGLRGPNLTVSGSPSVGAHVVERAYSLIHGNRADQLFVGSSESIGFGTFLACELSVFLKLESSELCAEAQGPTVSMRVVSPRDEPQLGAASNALAERVGAVLKVHGGRARAPRDLVAVDLAQSSSVGSDFVPLLQLAEIFLRRSEFAHSQLVVPMQVGRILRAILVEIE